MISRIMVVDPQPDPQRGDILVYQVPEKSREFKLLTELFSAAGLEWTVVESRQWRKEKK
jgi:hypothetical protein